MPNSGTAMFSEEGSVSAPRGQSSVIARDHHPMCPDTVIHACWGLLPMASTATVRHVRDLVGIDRFIDGKEMSHCFPGGIPGTRSLLRLHGARNGAIRVLLIRG